MVEKTEQATPSPEAPKATEQTTTPPGITEAINQFKADQAKQATEAKAKEAPPEEKPEAKAEETKPKEDTKEPEKKETKGEPGADEKKPTSGSLTFVDEGTEVTLDLANEEDRKKAETWLGQGKRFSQHKQSLNEREALIGTQEAVLKAVRDGKLVPADKVQPPEKEQAVPELDLGDLADDYPEVATAFKGLQSTVNEQTKAITFMNQIIAKNTMESAYKELTSRIDTAKKEHNLANDTEVWNMLKEVTDDKMPKYTPEEAVKISHDNIKKQQEGHIDKEGFVKMTPELEQEIILKHKAKEAELNKAPVSPPSGLPAGSGVPPSDGKREFKGIADAVSAFQKDRGGASGAKNF